MFLLVAAAKVVPSGERILFILGGLFATWWLVVEYWFKRRVGGPKGGGEKEIVGILWFLAAVIVGIAIAARKG
ncbi:hypothetical protein GCM10023321_43540 [Pseudonocardia eucalypti]|uniref:Uncharacterized protein n=1 Tax=Pseudonocardia eucalypti TaxID=648755 RepID=A0ABP9QEI2_9PSEU|nr:hypothetical protein [Pseudonocardia eucalypti]